jgi:hypothetical protein
MVLEITPRKRFVNFESVSLDGMENGKKRKDDDAYFDPQGIPKPFKTIPGNNHPLLGLL